jgi:hypothetical protein
MAASCCTLRVVPSSAARCRANSRPVSASVASAMKAAARAIASDRDSATASCTDGRVPYQPAAALSPSPTTNNETAARASRRSHRWAFRFRWTSLRTAERRLAGAEGSGRFVNCRSIDSRSSRLGESMLHTGSIGTGANGGNRERLSINQALCVLPFLLFKKCWSLHLRKLFRQPRPQLGERSPIAAGHCALRHVRDVGDLAKCQTRKNLQRN